MIRTAVIDNDPMVLGFVRGVLADANDITVTAAHTCVADHLAAGVRVDVVLLDLFLEDGTDPASNVTRVRESGTRVLVMSVSSNRLHVRAAIRAGASGYLVKNDSTLAESIRTVHAGGQALTAELMTIIADDPPRLSTRERDVLRLYGTGSTLLATARKLGIEVPTVRTYLNNIRTKWAHTGEDLSGRKIEKIVGEYRVPRPGGGQPPGDPAP